MLVALRRLCRGGGRQPSAGMSAMSTASTTPRFQPSFDPYTYTHGRWLDRDQERLEARHLHFNFDALLDVAVKCSPGAEDVVDCIKKEGGFNRVFIIHLDNGKTVVARLPTRTAGPPNLTVSSEVATLQFVSQKTTVPVPNVLSWSSETNNAIGSEYIIMDSVSGVPLNEVWNTMTASQHIRCIQSLGHLCIQLWKLDFPGYGSLYLNTRSPPDAVPLDDTFSIGPLCAAHLWGYDALETHHVVTTTGSLGPWHSLEAYLSGLLSQAQTSVPANAGQKTSLRELNSVEARGALFETARKALEVIKGTGAVKDASGPTLFHPDLHTRNIFVHADDPTIITGIIDWQSAAIEPAFMLTADTPDFATKVPHDENASNTEGDELSPQAKICVDADFCAKVWAVMLHICPKTRAAHDLDQSVVNFLAAGSAGWLKDAVSMRQILLELGRKWEELHLPGQPLYEPCEKETAELERQLDMMKTDHRLREHLASSLGCQTDGWVPVERWEEVLPAYRQEYRRFIDSWLDESAADDVDNALREPNLIWPFDQR